MVVSPPIEDQSRGEIACLEAHFCVSEPFFQISNCPFHRFHLIQMLFIEDNAMGDVFSSRSTDSRPLFLVSNESDCWPFQNYRESLSRILIFSLLLHCGHLILDSSFENPKRLRNNSLNIRRQFAFLSSRRAHISKGRCRPNSL